MPVVKLIEVQSSQIHAIGHDPETNTLAIRFYKDHGRDQRPGSLYHYASVTAKQFADFMAAPSKGRHFALEFKKNTVDHPFTKIESAPAPSAE